jgi:aromatic-L-amino-acid/L-tryptophan decarboxylase
VFPPPSVVPRPLELSGVDLRALMDAVMDRVAAHIDSLPTQPAHDVDGAEDVARSLAEPIPERGRPLADVLELLFDRAVPPSFNAAGPGYLAYIPGGGLPHSAVADFIADAVNRYTGVWLAAPGLVQLETNVLRWLTRAVGYPDSALGILTSGGSFANFSALVAARARYLGDEDLRDGTLYVSDQVHHSVVKAAMLAGLPARNVREIPSDEGFRVRIPELEAAIVRDRASGKHPFLIVGSGGTVNTGAVDDLTSLATVADREGLWFHVDAAYGGFFALTERGRSALTGMERADSITLDPHKGLFLPYGTGALLVRDAHTLRQAHSTEGAYLPQMRDDGDFVDFCQISPELSRPFRGLRLWLPLNLAGAGAFRAALDEKLDLARFAAEALRRMPGVEIVAEPELSLVAFRVTRPTLGDDATNALNRRWLEAVNRRRRVYLTGTTVRGRFLLRICVLSFRTHQDRMEQCIDDLREALADLAA